MLIGQLLDPRCSGGAMAGKTVTRADLCEAVYQKVGLSRTESAMLVELVLKEITDCLERGETVKLSSFGSFVVRKKGQRIGRNPKTGKEVPISPRRAAASASRRRRGGRRGGCRRRATGDPRIAWALAIDPRRHRRAGCRPWSGQRPDRALARNGARSVAVLRRTRCFQRASARGPPQAPGGAVRARRMPQIARCGARRGLSEIPRAIPARLRRRARARARCAAHGT